jgi:predicted alpha/beta superfamily hydrolase
LQKDSFDIWSPQLRNRRNVDVYLPDSYEAAGRQRYPVVYMQDGQNLSDPAIALAGQTWHLHEGLAWLAGRGIEPIVVGIHNTPARLAEYSPMSDARHGGGDGDKYARVLIDTLKPRIDSAYRTRRDRDGTVVAGSSMGGLIALYLFFRRPSPFGCAAVISPSIWFAGRSILEFVERARQTRGFLYLDVGTSEGPGTLRNARALNRLLRRKGYRRDRLRYLEAEGHQHREADWAWRLPQALEFLLRTNP